MKKRTEYAINTDETYKKERDYIAKNDLSVITKAKDLCDYIMTITDKSPKRFRFTLVSRLQNYALDVIENLIRANETFVSAGDALSQRERLGFQRKAMTSLKLLGYISELAMKQGCILPKQYEQITKHVYDTENMLGAWMNSDRKRYGQEPSGNGMRNKENG